MLKQSNCIKRITNSGGGDLIADAGESFLVKAIHCLPSTNDTYLVLRVDRKTVGVYRVKGRGGNHLPYRRSGYLSQNLMEFLDSKGINVKIPVAEGQTFTVSRVAEAGDVAIVYDMYDAGDILATMPNGSDAKEYTFIQYMDSTETPAVAGDVLVNTSLSPAEFPDFPCGKTVPARNTIDILGLLGTPVADATDGANYQKSEYLKLVKERETLFDEDRHGIPFFATTPTAVGTTYIADNTLLGDSAEILAALTPNVLAPPLMFEPALHFVSGEELLVSATFALTGSHTLTTSILSLAAIMKVTVE